MSTELWRVIFERRLELLNEFQWLPDFKRQVTDQMFQWVANRTFSVTVGVHVRLRDFEHHLNSLYGESKLADEEYFYNAMNYYRSAGGQHIPRNCDITAQ